MTPVASRTDPRSVITPDAFQVSPELLGLKLASGGRRLAAIAVDLVVIGVLTAVTRSFALVLGLVVAVLLVRAGFRRTTARGTVLHRAMRGSIGLLGVSIGLVTLLVWWNVGPSGSSTNDDDERAGVGTEDGRSSSADPRAASGATLESRDLAAVRDEISLYSTEEALDAYAALLRSGRSDAMDLARRAALEARLTNAVAADTLRVLQARVSALADDLADVREDRDEAEAELDELESGRLFATVRSAVDELGFGFGWASLYFTVMLSWWRGQTIGKRLLGTRVLRLDGAPINWWVAFERSGGYAAGFATGFLGFLQVFWDANRQMIHDRIVGTVVALDPPRKAL